MHLHPLDVRITYRGTPGSDVQDAEELTLSTMAQLNDARYVHAATRSSRLCAYGLVLLCFCPFLIVFFKARPLTVSLLVCVLDVVHDTLCLAVGLFFAAATCFFGVLNAGQNALCTCVV